MTAWEKSEGDCDRPELAGLSQSRDRASQPLNGQVCLTPPHLPRLRRRSHVTNSNHCRGNHGECATHLRTMLRDGLQHDARSFHRGYARKTDQNDARVHLALSEHDLAEVLVACQ